MNVHPDPVRWVATQGKGGENVIHVPPGRGEHLRSHLESHGIHSLVSPPAQNRFERLEVGPAMDSEALQAIVSQWKG